MPRTLLHLLRALPVWAYVLLLYGFIFLPVGVLVLFSFQESRIPVPPFNGPSLRWYEAVFTDPRMMDALANSVAVALASSLTAVVLSANDPVAAWGGVKLLRERFGIEPCAVTGPSTDNAVGVDIIREQMGVAAFNAMTSGAALGDHVIAATGLDAIARAPVSQE